MRKQYKHVIDLSFWLIVFSIAYYTNNAVLLVSLLLFSIFSKLHSIVIILEGFLNQAKDNADKRSEKDES